MVVYESDADWEPGEIVRISTTFKGILAGNPEELGQHEFTRSVTEAPIETNPMFSIPRDNPPVTPDEIADIELALQNNYKKLAKDASAAAKKLFDMKRRGIESYLKPGGIYKVSYVSPNIPSVANIGRIVTPPSPCPAAPDGQNYLCMAIVWNKQANIVSITKEYQLSGPGGWDPDLYETGT